MATFKDLNDIYRKMYDKDIPPSTVCKWIKENKIKAIKLNNGRWDYDQNSFLDVISTEQYKKSLKASKHRPIDYVGTTVNFLYIKAIVPQEERTLGYLGTEMYCDCLRCGKKNIKIRFTYLNKNGNYTQKSCGCYKEIRHYLACCRDGITEEFLEQYSKNFDRYRFINSLLIHLSSGYYLQCGLEEYKEALDYFYHDEQFNKVYDFWNVRKKQEDTFYDWAKPSIDHITPLSKGGTDHISNLQILTVFENLNKRDMTMEEWNRFKQKTHTYSDYYIENILGVSK